MYRCLTSVCELCEKYYVMNQKVGVCYYKDGKNKCYHWTCMKKFHKDLPHQEFNGILFSYSGIPDAIEKWDDLDKYIQESAKRNLEILNKYAKL